VAIPGIRVRPKRPFLNKDDFAGLKDCQIFRNYVIWLHTALWQRNLAALFPEPQRALYIFSLVVDRNAPAPW